MNEKFVPESAPKVIERDVCSCPMCFKKADFYCTEQWGIIINKPVVQYVDTIYCTNCEFKESNSWIEYNP